MFNNRENTVGASNCPITVVEYSHLQLGSRREKTRFDIIFHACSKQIEMLISF